jgi:lipoprotein-anchoring transpeptidase ErfK/SrfK
VAFGGPSSHGCLGLQVDDAAWLYNLTTIGTLVAVHN